LFPLLSWTAGIDATSYVINIGPGSTLPLSPTVIPLAATSYPLTATSPILLTAGTTYTWRVDSVNANGTTLGPVQTFIAHAAGVAPGSTGVTTTTSTTSSTGVTTPAGSSSGGGKCFIATAAYGSSDRRAVKDICRLRDDLLLQFPAGRAFSAWYYAVGPYGAAAIRENEPAMAVVRALLVDPLAALSRECSQPEK
jgi:hypothetical protein